MIFMTNERKTRGKLVREIWKLLKTKTMEGSKQPTQRLVRIRRRKVLSDVSNPVPARDQENSSPQHPSPRTKRAKRALEVSPTPPSTTPSQAPLEWELKTKARFISPHSFDWVKTKKARQESQGIAAFVHRDSSSHSLTSVSELQSHLMFWEHPSLPSLSPFVSNDSRQRASLVALRETAFIDALKEDWSTSFRSVFQQFRLGACPYFYLCACHFTVLFLTTSSPTAVISPTTSGLRKAFGREGVRFSLPLDVRKADPKEVVSEETQDSDSDDECSSWLTSMIGSDGTALTNKINTRPNSHQSIDNRPESTLLVESSSLQSLFNYLLNCKTLVAPTGPLAGIPPTILSPVAFEGGTLRALKTTVGSISEEGGCGLIRKQYLDVSGPILPHNLQNLCALLSRSQHNEFKVHTVMSEFTSVFSTALSQDTTNS